VVQEDAGHPGQKTVDVKSNNWKKGAEEEEEIRVAAPQHLQWGQLYERVLKCSTF
jgi:N-dimethylarginine dimethylaminohydrolase